MPRQILRAARLGVALVLVIAACGGDDAAGGTATVSVSGSSTVEPISALNAEKFATANPGVAISVQGPGTGDGFAQFCGGSVDIADASRAIKVGEAEDCAANGIEWIELQVAIDGLSVLTSTENSDVTCLGSADLYALLGDESLGFDSWADANDLAAEIGAPNAPYPDVPLVVTAPGEESGTFDTFVEFLIEGKAGGEDYEETRGVNNVRPDYVASANDNVIIDGVRSSESSLGWVGFAFYLENQDTVKALAIDVTNTGDCVGPTPSTIADGTYPFSRPLYIYVSTASAQRQEVVDYIDFYLSEDGLASVDETGYVRLADYEAVRATWESRTTGRVFSE